MWQGGHYSTRRLFNSLRSYLRFHQLQAGVLCMYHWQDGSLASYRVMQPSRHVFWCLGTCVTFAECLVYLATAECCMWSTINGHIKGGKDDLTSQDKFFVPSRDCNSLTLAECSGFCMLYLLVLTCSQGCHIGRHAAQQASTRKS